MRIPYTLRTERCNYTSNERALYIFDKADYVQTSYLTMHPLTAYFVGFLNVIDLLVWKCSPPLNLVVISLSQDHATQEML